MKYHRDSSPIKIAQFLQMGILHLRSIVVILLLLPFLSLSASSSRNPYLDLLPKTTKSVSDGGDDLYCDSWRYSVETNNAGPWKTVPARCGSFVANYMNGARYKSDSEVVAADSLAFAKTVDTSDGKGVWVFDVDETLLSNLPYYADNGYGVIAYNETRWDEWVNVAKAPAIPASLQLYHQIKALGFRVVILTGRGEDQREKTEQNLKWAGYDSWERVILRNATDNGKTAVVYKSGKRAMLESEGYKIHGSSGDQWSDLFGSPIAARSFKLPNPMYYIS